MPLTPANVDESPSSRSRASGEAYRQEVRSGGTDITFADLVTELRAIEHPFGEQGSAAQKGIEL